MGLTFKVLIHVATAILAVFAALSDTRDDHGRLTKAGKWLLAIIATSAVLSIFATFYDRGEEADRERAGHLQFETQLSKQEQTLLRLAQVANRQEMLVDRAGATLGRLSKVDDKLSATARQGDDVQKRSTTNLAATRDVLLNVNKLLTPFSVTAIDVRIEYDLGRDDYSAWRKRLLAFIATMDKQDIRPGIDMDIVGPEMVREYRNGKLIGIRLNQNSSLWPNRSHEELIPTVTLGCACLKIYFESNILKTKSATAAEVGGTSELPLYPALAYAVDDDLLATLSPRRLTPEPSRALQRQWFNSDPTVPVFELEIDMEASCATRHVVVIRPRPVIDNKTVTSAADLAGGAVWYELPSEHTKAGARVVSVELDLDVSRTGVVLLPVRSAVKIPGQSGERSPGLWRADLTSKDLRTRTIRRFWR